MPLSVCARRGAWVLLAALAAGCAAPGRLYVNSEADMAYYTKVAVLPFANLSSERYAGERVLRTFVTELVIAERFEIVDPGEVRAVLDRIGGLPTGEGTFDPKKLKEAVTEVGATGYIRGAVTEYGTQRSGSGDVPVLAFDVELIDLQTGHVVWRASTTKRGKGRVPLLGAGVRTMSRLTQDACREIVQRIVRGAY